MQSMLFIKSGGKPGQPSQPWHQDEDFIPTRDRSLCGGWIALDDATTENGCLWVLPGSHKPRRALSAGPCTRRQPASTAPRRSHRFPLDRDEEAVRRAEVKAGINPLLQRLPAPPLVCRTPQKPGSAACLVNHYMSATSLLPVDRQPRRARRPSSTTATPSPRPTYRDVVMVAGEDPYAWRGTHDRAKPFVRPAGGGGCAKDPVAESPSSSAANA